MKVPDFSNPQWEDRRLKEFLFETFKHEKTYKGEQYQYLLFWQGKIENELWKLYHQDRDKFFELFGTESLLKIQIHKDELESCINNIGRNVLEWQSELCTMERNIRFFSYINSPLLQCYAKFAGKFDSHSKNFIKAIEVLSDKLFNIKIDCESEELSFPDETERRSDSKACTYVANEISFEEFFLRDFSVFAARTQNYITAIDPYDSKTLLNSNYIESNPDAPVFMLDSLLLANILQGKYCQIYLDQKWEEATSFIKENMDMFNLNQDPNNRIKKKNFESARNNYESFKDKFEQAILWENRNGNLKSKLTFSSVYGGGSILSELDLAPLKDRNVYWVMHQDISKKQILEKFINTLEVLYDKELKKLKFIHIPEITNIHDVEKSGITIWSKEDLIYEAFDRKIDIPENLKLEFSDFLAKKFRTKKKQSYIIDPIIRKNALVLLTAKTGHGKSYLSMAFSYAAATKGKLFGEWHVKEKVKVLYVHDYEIDNDELEKRKKIFNKIYPKQKKSKSVSFYPVSNFNLLSENHQEEIERILIDKQLNAFPEGEPIRLLVLDHLTKLCPNATRQDTWNQLRPWINSLINDMNISVLLLHHHNKTRGVYGTSFIENDANSRIHIEKKENDAALAMDVSLPKNRHGKTKDNAYKVELHMDLEDRIYLKCETDDTPPPSWKTLSNDDRIKIFVSMRENMSMNELALHFGIKLPTLELFATTNKLTKNRWKELLKSEEKSNDKKDKGK
jgi:hypothetical protein